MKLSSEDTVRLLRSIYRHLDRPRVLEEFRGLTEESLLAFFKELKLCLGSDRLAEKEASPPEKQGPAAGHVLVHCDGGSRGNPGPAGCGYVLYDATGQVVAKGSRFLGRTTNNVAEYEGFIAALEKARSLGADSVAIRSDSLLLVEQLNGGFRVRSAHLRPLHARVRELMASFGTCRVEHVPRDMNRMADELANQAMNRGL